MGWVADVVTVRLTDGRALRGSTTSCRSPDWPGGPVGPGQTMIPSRIPSRPGRRIPAGLI